MTSKSRFALVLLVAHAGCADLERGPSTRTDAGVVDGAGEGGSSDGGAPSFAASIEPLLVSACQHCHSAGQPAAETQLLVTGAAQTDYPVVVKLINVSAPSSSRLLAKMSGQGHGGGTVYAVGSPQYQTILEWIQQGAPE
jgi:hypothetical protein